jgi:hypothetical protein
MLRFVTFPAKIRGSVKNSQVSWKIRVDLEACIGSLTEKAGILGT